MASVVTTRKGKQRSASKARTSKSIPEKAKTSKKSKKTASKKTTRKTTKPAPVSPISASKGFKKTRVAARKATIRAPAVNVKSINTKVEEAIAQQEQKAEIASTKVVRRGRSKFGSDEVVVNSLNTDTKAQAKSRVKSSLQAQVQESIPPVQTRESVRSPSVSPQRRGARVIFPFLGGQRLATLARETFSRNSSVNTVVVEKAVFELGKQRRQRLVWSEAEIESLQNGVRIHGESSWAAILNNPKLKFNSHRTQVDLKDKWRNLTAYKSYQEHPIRRFVLVNSRHDDILTESGNQHILNNRWPRDAALKMSTKDWIYPIDTNGTRADSALIHLKEVLDSEGKNWRPQVVHIYRVTRILQKPKSIKKFAGYAAVWTGKVDKIAEEMLVKSNEIFPRENNAGQSSPIKRANSGTLNNFTINL